jgi:hypothetical protein
MKKYIYIIYLIGMSTIYSYSQATFTVASTPSRCLYEDGAINVILIDSLLPLYPLPYKVEIEDLATNETFFDVMDKNNFFIHQVKPGNYRLKIFLSESCKHLHEVAVLRSTLKTNIQDATIKNTCLNQGSISIKSTAQNTYKWSDGQSSSSIENLVPGNYTVTITNSQGCSDIFTYTVAKEVLINKPTILYPSELSCTANSGQIEIVDQDLYYSYLWNTGATTPSISNLNAGTYTVTITEQATGCQTIENITMTS